MPRVAGASLAIAPQRFKSFSDCPAPIKCNSRAGAKNLRQKLPGSLQFYAQGRRPGTLGSTNLADERLGARGGLPISETRNSSCANTAPFTPLARISLIVLPLPLCCRRPSLVAAVLFKCSGITSLPDVSSLLGANRPAPTVPEQGHTIFIVSEQGHTEFMLERRLGGPRS